jgi:hypothetical protein
VNETTRVLIIVEIKQKDHSKCGLMEKIQSRYFMDEERGQFENPKGRKRQQLEAVTVRQVCNSDT